MKIFSQRLAALRKEREMSQADLAKVLNRTRSTISGYETECKEPDFEILCSLARFFSVSVDYLLGVEDCKNHSDVVFVNDSLNFKKHYDSLPSHMRHKVARAYDSFYLLFNRDMVTRNERSIELCGDLLSALQSSRAQIKSVVNEYKGQVSDPLLLSNIMALQSSFKNDVCTLLDKLLQSDIESAFGVNANGPDLSEIKKD